MSNSTPPASYYLIYLLRHGESIGNAEGLHQGQKDFPLTPTGRSQARALAKRWKKERMTFSLIISSPLLRARQTAEIIADSLEIPTGFDQDWMERDNGLLSGLRPEEAVEIYPRPDFIPPYQAIGETGESQWELYIRASRAVQSLIKRPPGRYLVVSHGGLLNMAFYAILGIAPQANFTGPRFRFGNTAFAILTYHPGQHKWSVLSVNDHRHWRELDT